MNLFVVVGAVHPEEHFEKSEAALLHALEMVDVLLGAAISIEIHRTKKNYKKSRKPEKKVQTQFTS